MEQKPTRLLSDLADFTSEAYAKDNNGRRAYINTILHNRGEDVSSDWIGVLDELGGRRLATSFFKYFDYSPESRLGQLVQLIASEGSLSTYIREQVRINGKGARVTEASTDVLPHVHKAKRKIAKEIFGKEAEEYMERLSQTFYSHRIKNPDKPDETENKRLRKRRIAFSELVQEVTDNFPLTSR